MVLKKLSSLKKNNWANNKILGIGFSCALLVTSVFASAILSEQPFVHQYDVQSSIPSLDETTFDDDDWTTRPIDKDDYCLDDYFFADLAGEVMDEAPLINYVRYNNELLIASEAPAICVKEYDYILKVIPLEIANKWAKKETRITSFVDYNYLSTNGRYVFALNTGTYSLNEIKDELSYFEKCLYSYDFEDDDYGHQANLNERSFVDYFLLYELAFPGYYDEENFVIYKDQHDRYHILTTDFENSCTSEDEGEGDYHNLVATMWFSMLSKSQIFTDYVIEEYDYLRKGVLANKAIEERVNACANFLLNSDGIDTDEVLKEKEVLLNYLTKRLSWLDENIQSIQKYSAYSAVKEYRNTPY